MKLRIAMSCLGVLIGGISVGMFRTAALGVDPFQSLMSGLDSLIPIGFGTLYLIANAVLLLVSLIFDRHKIGLATLINLTLLGYAAEYSQKFFEYIFPKLSFFPSLLLLVTAIIVMCFGSAMYFNADLGVSTYDAISLMISERQTRVSFKICRILSDLICVTLGVILCRVSGMSWADVTGVVGIGTVITAFFMGPLISFFSGLLPFSEKKAGKESPSEAK